jgi:hypothetical protein
MAWQIGKQPGMFIHQGIAIVDKLDTRRGTSSPKDWRNQKISKEIVRDLKALI